ncbi:hypothetical protein MPTK1_2g10550 [Marchantia polymorpha subsp. ruderalis]|nr:CP12 [Marchantia polymorpha]PTQ43687.1 hypothetical protein MARPO_0023s0024 [Marchantia polymorpha]BBN01824.1 hypothetical protein Mp_2g10550 [Marchantia polymorpha subsp. ruderalis]|eukprot:PTQ43687.1 hypothetical protein MARPO_0023s0024 [Marchantia polymorpha]
MACLTSAGALCSSVLAAPSAVSCISKSSTAKFRVAPIAVKPLSRRCSTFVVRASSPNSADDLQAKVAESIKAATEVCKGNETSEECVVAWDETEELSAAYADKKRKAKADPLETYCADNPETDECRVYED